MSDQLTEVALRFLPLILFLVLMFFGLRFLLRKSHTGMNTSIEMQKRAMEEQEEAMRICRETFELNKNMLSEMKAIRNLLEKR